METILHCCCNNPTYRLNFVNDDNIYKVCEHCAKLLHWSRNIESKKELDKLEGKN